MAHTADYPSCEEEPIRRLGLVQSYGCLLLSDPSGTRIADASANAEAMLRLPACPIGVLLRELLPGWRPEAANSRSPAPVALAGPRGATGWVALAHRSDEAFIIEFVPRKEEPQPGFAFSGFSAPDNLYRCASEAVSAVRAITGYDRVMAYRFDRDGCGEVIAEERRPEMVPFLGLHFPAADIPAQARALFAQVSVRLLADVSARPAAMIAAGEAPDLGLAALRQPSAMHVEYLQNMGVRASMTLPVVVEGRLWGMIACHHRDARLLGLGAQRAAVGMVGTFRQAVRAATERRQRRANAHVAAVREAWLSRDAGRVLSGAAGVAAATGADGAAIVCGRTIHALGCTPGPDWIDAFLATAEARKAAPGAAIAHERRLQVGPGVDPAAGVLAVRSRLPDCWLLAFRKPVVQEVFWGGDPTEPGTVDPKTGRAGPRKSFAVWRELSSDAARPWEAQEIEALIAIADSLPSRGLEAIARKEFDEVSLGVEADQAMRTLVLGLVPDGTAVMLTRASDLGEAAILHASRSFMETFGLAGEDLAGRAPAALAQRTHLPVDLLTGVGPDEREVETWSAQAGMRRLRVRRERVGYGRTASGFTEITSLTLHDVTHAARTIDALQAAMRQALAAQETAGALMRNMSHEMRTPLNAIIANAELIKGELLGAVGDEAYREAAADIAAAGSHLLQVVSNALEAARLESAQTALADAVIDLAEPVDQAVRLGHALAAEKQIRILWSRPDLGPWLADATAVRQMALNLLSNAIKFTPRNGEVEVTLATHASGDALIRVRDTGMGIAPEDMPRLFRPFSQLDPRIDRRHGGAGLGLALVKALVTLHGGAVSVESEPGRGAAFTLTFPAWRRRWTACAS